MRSALLVAVAALTAACQSVPDVPPEPPVPPFPDAWTTVDLTRPLDPETPVLRHPQGFPFERLPLEGPVAGRFTGAWSATDLLGTHVETPSVFGEGDARVDRIAVRDLTLSVVVIEAPPRLTVQDGEEAPHVTGVSALFAHEARFGTIPRGSLVLLRTGLGERPSAELRAMVREGLDNAGWSVDAVRFLARERGIRAIGTDALTLDAGPDVEESPAAREAARLRLLTVQGLANLSVLPPRGAVVVLGIVPVAGAAAAPARVLGLVPPPETSWDGRSPAR